MKKTLKIILRVFIILFDVALVPFLILCRWLSGQMLETESTCLLLQFNGKCLSCGGTHFVRDLLSGRIFDAFMDNHFFFVCTLYLLITLVALNLYLLFNLKFAKKMLRYMYNLPALFAFITFLFLFLILRNIPMIVFFSKLVPQISIEISESILRNDWEGAIKNPTVWDIILGFFPFIAPMVS